MAFQVSPGVNVSEIDLTTVVPAVATTTGGIGGLFRWGPIGQLVLVDSEATLVNRFGKPTNFNAETFFSAANFLAYGNALVVSRGANTTSSTTSIGTITAVANTGTHAFNATFNILNSDDYDTKDSQGDFSANTEVLYAAKYPGDLGNNLKISVCDNPTQYSSSIANVAATTFNGTTATITFDDTGSYVRANTAYQALTNGDWLYVGNSSVGFQYVQIVNKGAVSPVDENLTLTLAGNYTLSASVSMSGTITRKWEHWQSVDSAPGSSDYNTNFGNTAAVDEVHVVVSDEDGKFTGTANTVLEKYAFVSKASDAINNDGSTNYYKNVINSQSRYVWWMGHQPGSSSWGTAAAGTTYTNPNTAFSASMSSGADGTIGNTEVIAAYNKMANPDSIDISLIVSGPGNATVAASLITLAETRKDAMVFLSPTKSSVVNNAGSESSAVISFRDSLTSSYYAVIDSGYKYQFDKYNNVYRWVPLNGDIAGLCAKTDQERDPWFSPGGLNRGVLRNVIKLAWNPTKTNRDDMYVKGVNPVVTFPGEGTVLFGDKTMLSKPSVFDRINVRRLFIVLEKAVSRAARSSLFEFNDQFTRAQFVALVEPYLRDVAGRRGITDYRVVCDESNNTAEVIDRNEFVGDIYIKPARSVNFIQLNFVAVRTGVTFEEIVGRF